MIDQIKKFRAELLAVEKPSPWQCVAATQLEAAAQNLTWHAEAAAKAGASPEGPAVVEGVPPSAPKPKK